MSLTNVLLIHVSSRYMPRNDAEEATENENEYYRVLELSKYAPIYEIRKSYRRLTLKFQCDRMMLEWQNDNGDEQLLKSLSEQEARVKQAFHVLGDKHLRQQYHLLQCRPSRYKIIKGPLAVIHGLTLSRRWFPLLVLQSVIVATMVNAVVAQYETQEWVYVLIPAFGYYGTIVLFWLFMLEFPWRKHCTRDSFLAMLCAFLQHACFWNGCFWMARKWDRNTRPGVDWYVLSLPFYAAILCRCLCSRVAVQSLKELRSKMVSRARMEQEQQAGTTTRQLAPATLPSGYIVVTHDQNLFAGHLLQLSLQNNDESNNSRTDANLVETARVETSPEYRQVQHAEESLHRSAVQLATLGTAFVTLTALKLEGALGNLTWWVVFFPVWIYFAMRLVVTSRAPNRAPPVVASGSGSNNTTTIIGNTDANNNPQTTTSEQDQKDPPPTDMEGPSSIATPTKATATTDTDTGESATTAEEQSSEPQSAPEVPNPVTSKSLWTGEYTAVDVVMDPPPASAQIPNDVLVALEEKSPSHVPIDTNAATVYEPVDDQDLDLENQDMKIKFKMENQISPLQSLENNPETQQSLVDTVQLVLTADERDVEAAILLTNNPDANNTQSPHDDDNSETNEEEDKGQVHEEFERWQSVYENQDVRQGHFRFLPCEVFFRLLIVCLIVAKLDQSYQNTSPYDSSFNTFYILLVPFSVGLIVCCCALVAGFIALNTAAQEASPLGRDDVEEGMEGDTNNGQEGSNDELSPMQAGATNPPIKTFAAHIDVARPDLTFSQRVQLLTSALPITTAQAETWLLDHDVRFVGSSKTVWKQVVSCAEGLEITTINENEEDIADIDPAFDQECIQLLRTNLEAHFREAEFQEQLASIRPVEDDDYLNENGVANAGAVECLVCCEDYDLKDMVHCDADDVHFFCKGCFHRYATETLQAGDVAGMPCADAHCTATFSTPTVTANLSPWELLRRSDREAERNHKVALAAKAVLQCTCGAVGIVTEDQVGDGCIVCPGEGCDLKFCALCGNHWHPETSCPPTKKMLQWVVQNTMPCPNCRTPIEKNYGCDHMHCAPPGGCGHHFSYRTGKPMSKHGRNLRGLYA